MTWIRVLAVWREMKGALEVFFKIKWQDLGTETFHRGISISTKSYLDFFWSWLELVESLVKKRERERPSPQKKNSPEYSLVFSECKI